MSAGTLLAGYASSTAGPGPAVPLLRGVDTMPEPTGADARRSSEVQLASLGGPPQGRRALPSLCRLQAAGHGVRMARWWRSAQRTSRQTASAMNGSDGSQTDRLTLLGTSQRRRGISPHASVDESIWPPA